MMATTVKEEKPLPGYPEVSVPVMTSTIKKEKLLVKEEKLLPGHLDDSLTVFQVEKSLAGYPEDPATTDQVPIIDDSLTSLHWLNKFSIPGVDPERRWKGVASCPSSDSPSSPPDVSTRCCVDAAVTRMPLHPLAGNTAVTSTPLQLESSPDASVRPPYSYHSLIYRAIQADKQSKMTLANIYKWMTENFPYYRNSKNHTWQSSIRHTLSANRCFMKVCKEQDEGGKGGYWQINPEHAHMFVGGIFKSRTLGNFVHYAQTKKKRKLLLKRQRVKELQDTMATTVKEEESLPDCQEVRVPDMTSVIKEEKLLPGYPEDEVLLDKMATKVKEEKPLPGYPEVSVPVMTSTIKEVKSLPVAIVKEEKLLPGYPEDDSKDEATDEVHLDDSLTVFQVEKSLADYPEDPATTDQVHIIDGSLTSLHWLNKLSIPGVDPERRWKGVASCPSSDSPSSPPDVSTWCCVAVTSTPLQLESSGDASIRPPYSFPSLIYRAIQADKQSKMTLANIYKWMTDNFPYYRNSKNHTWQNSIRHTLSANRCFMTVCKEQDEGGKGGYWQVNPKYAHTFVSGIYKRSALGNLVHHTQKRELLPQSHNAAAQGHSTAVPNHSTELQGHTAVVVPNHNSAVQEHNDVVQTTVLQGHTTAVQGHTTAGQGHATAVQGHTTAVQGHTTVLQGHTTAGQGHATAVQGHATAGQGHTAAGQGHATAGQGHKRRRLLPKHHSTVVEQGHDTLRHSILVVQGHSPGVQILTPCVQICLPLCQVSKSYRPVSK